MRCATAIFKIQKLDCVVVNDTVHMVRFALCGYILVCDVTHEWVPYLFCAIEICDSNVSILKIASKPIAPCEQFHKNACIKLLSHAECV